jgi:hypothetical protein
MKHYLCILVIGDIAPSEIENPSTRWIMNPNICTMNREIWKRYMNAEKEDIFSLFVHFDKNLKDGECILDNDTQTLRIGGKHSYTPGGSLLTVFGFEYILKHFSFDFIFRCTLSMFIVLPRLKNILQNESRIQIYKGNIIPYYEWNIYYAAGSTILFSKDVVNIIVKKKDIILDFVNNTYIPCIGGIQNVTDDVALGKLLPLFGITATEADFNEAGKNIQRLDNIDEIIKETDKLGTAYYRVKTGEYNCDYTNRLEDDTIVLNKLYDYYYT